MESLKEQVNNILGYGKKIDILVGVYDKDEDGHKKGDEKIRTIHLTPVSVSKLSELDEKINKFFNLAADPKSEEFLSNLDDLVMMLTAKMHPDLDKKEIRELFDLIGVAEVLDIALNIGDFINRVKKMGDKIMGIAEEINPEMMKKSN